MNDLTTAGKVPSSLLRRLFLLCWFVATVVGAQTSEVDLFRQLSPQHDSDSIEMKTLYLDADALAFFKDNEYDGNITKGYTLPGVRFTPHLVYSPRAELRFELGASALVYDGTNRYPNYAFHDIVTWKGGAYQGGAHVLPYFRAVVRMGAATFVLGDLYGGASHELILPLYKPENLLTTDPEKGFQTQISTQRWKMDAWIDWQSFIFEMDKHQEAFTVGMTQRVHLLRPRRYGWSLDVPLQMTVQHRGGEQDDTDMGVQTLSNGSIGLQLRKTWNHRVLNAAEAELHVLGHERGCQRLGVGIANEEANTFDVLAIHVADGVAAAAADTDDFDDGYGSLGLFGGSELNDGLEVFLFVGLGGVIRHGVGFVPNRRWMLGVG